MRNEMEHERCSELLLAFVNDELDEGARADVADHLAGCPQCAEERQALEGLLAVEVPEMTEAERASLRAAVGDRLEALPATSREIIASGRRTGGWWRRAVPALGAAAVLLLGAVFAANLLSSEDGSESRGGGGQAGLTAPEEQPGERPEGAPAAGDAGLGRKAAPYFKSRRQPLASKDLSRLARKEAALFELAGVEAEKADQLRDAYTKTLSDQAPKDTRAQVVDCVDSVAGSQGAVVPAFGARGRYKGKEALLLGFVAGTNSGPLNRYMLWLWPRGSCEVPLRYVSGPIEK